MSYTVSDKVLKVRANETKIDRNLKIIELLKKMSIREVASIYNVSHNCIFQIKKKGKKHYLELKELLNENITN